MNSEVSTMPLDKSVADPEDCRVGSKYINEYLKCALNSGASKSVILKQAGLADAKLDDAEYSIDGVQLYDLFGALEQATNDIFQGFLEQPAKRALEEVHIKLAVQAKSLGEAIRVSTELREQLRYDVHYNYIHDETNHTFTLGVSGYELKSEASEYLFYWVRLMQIYRHYSWLIGRKMKLNSVGFVCDPDGQHDMNAIFGCEVKFNQKTNYICFDKKYLNAAIVRTETELLGLDQYYKYRNWFEVPGYDHSWARKVEDKLIELFQKQNESTSLDNVASHLKVSSRTLRRQLLLENEYFQHLKDKVRCKLAIRLLTTTDTPVTLLAGELGYAEPGSFTRAFLAWTNQAPSAYRKEHR